MPSPTAFTPRETVLVYGDRFAAKKSALASFVGAATLLDGVSRVSRRQLVTNMIKAALLAHEQEHGIYFKIQDAGKLGAGGLEKSVVHSSRLAVTSTGTPAEWPRATLESRLALNEMACVADIVFNWLGEYSSDPWRRAVEQGMIMLVLRGVASVRTSRTWGIFNGRTYLFAGDARSLPSQPLRRRSRTCWRAVAGSGPTCGGFSTPRLKRRSDVGRVEAKTSPTRPSTPGKAKPRA